MSALSLSLCISNCLEQYISIGNVQITYFTPENKYPFSQTPYPHPPPADPHPGHITTPNENPLVDEHPRTINIFNKKNKSNGVSSYPTKKPLPLVEPAAWCPHSKIGHTTTICCLNYPSSLSLFIPNVLLLFPTSEFVYFLPFSSIVLLPPFIVFYSFY